MTEEVKQEVELHDESVNDEIVEETLVDESTAPMPKGKPDANATDEEESIASVDKASKAVKKSPVPKTKAGMISAMTDKMLKMSKSEMNKLYASYSESVDMEENDELVETQVDTSAELDALVESEATLSDEFKAKTAILFETAVKSKLSEEVDRLEKQYKEELDEEVSSTKAELVEKVDSYLNYVVETWMEENQVAIQNGLRTEIAETFMDKMKDLFVESYIDVPESKVDLVDELAGQVEELEESLNKQTGDTIKLAEELETYKRNAIIAEAARGMAETQVEKLRGLVENVDFDDEESFASKVATIKESFFKAEKTEVAEQVTAEDPEEVEVEVSSVMEQYLKTIRQTANK